MRGHKNINAFLSVVITLQDCYPERLAKLFIVHVPYIFMTAWKVVYPFIDSRTKKKVYTIAKHFLFEKNTYSCNNWEGEEALTK